MFNKPSHSRICVRILCTCFSSHSKRTVQYLTGSPHLQWSAVIGLKLSGKASVQIIQIIVCGAHALKSIIWCYTQRARWRTLPPRKDLDDSGHENTLGSRGRSLRYPSEPLEISQDVHTRSKYITPTRYECSLALRQSCVFNGKIC